MARNTGNSGDADRDDAASRQAQDRRGDDARQASGGDAPRERYRDDDDQRDRLDGDERMGASPDTKHEARGSARANVGNTAHDQKDRDLKDRG